MAHIRTRFVPAICFATSTALFAQFPAVEIAFPRPLTPERPLSAPNWGAAPGAQARPLIATGAQGSLAVWLDDRAGGFGGTFASRLDRDGKVLDPIGIRVEKHGYPEAVLWNGEDFLVVIRQDQNLRTTRVAEDGTIVEQRLLELSPAYRFADVASSGWNAKLLFIASTGFVSVARVVDGHGRPVTGEIYLSRLPHGFYETYRIAGSRGDGEFLILRTLREERGTCGQPSCWRVIAERITVDGQIVSSVDSGLTIPADQSVVEGGNDGYLLVRQAWLERTTIAYPLDLSGVWSGRAEILFPEDPATRYINRHASLLFSGDRFLVAWEVSIATGLAFSHYAELAEDGTVLTNRRISEIPGISQSVALGTLPSGDRIILVAVFIPWNATGSDLFAYVFAPGGEDTVRSAVVTASATAQYEVQVAAGATASAAVWREVGPDEFQRLYVTLLTPEGVSAGEPIELVRANCCNYSLGDFAIASNGETFLITWVYGHIRKVFARRLSIGGDWIDAEPLEIGSGSFNSAGLASNGTDFLITWIDYRDRSGAVYARRLSGTGEPADAIVIARGDHYDAAVASNGSDYLVAWSDGFRICQILCFLDPFRILAARVRADGTLVDATPIIVEDRKSYGERVSIAWDGDRYLVIWNVSGRQIRGARVTPPGEVIDRTPGGEGMALATEREIAGKVIADSTGAILFVARRDGADAVWEAIRIPRHGSLIDVIFRTPHRLVDEAMADNPTRLSSLSASAQGLQLLVAYARITEEWGSVARIWVRVYGESLRTRSIRR